MPGDASPEGVVHGGPAPSPLPLQLWLDDGARTRLLLSEGGSDCAQLDELRRALDMEFESDPDLLKPAALRRRSPGSLPWVVANLFGIIRAG